MVQQVTMCSKKLQKIGMRTTFNDAQAIFFLKKGKSCYNTLQQVTMCYKRLETQYSPRTSWKVVQKFFFF